MKILECDGINTLFITILFPFVLAAVGTFDSIDALIIDANEKEMRPLRVALEYARQDARTTRSVLVACLNGDTIVLRDGLLWHYADCQDYKIKTVFVGERR